MLIDTGKESYLLFLGKKLLTMIRVKLSTQLTIWLMSFHSAGVNGEGNSYQGRLSYMSKVAVAAPENLANNYTLFIP